MSEQTLVLADEVALAAAGFDYEEVDPLAAKALKRCADGFRGEVVGLVRGMFQLGKFAAEAKAQFRGEGGTSTLWQRYCVDQLGVSSRTADRFARIYNSFSECEPAIVDRFTKDALEVLIDQKADPDDVLQRIEAAGSAPPVGRIGENVVRETVGAPKKPKQPKPGKGPKSSPKPETSEEQESPEPVDEWGEDDEDSDPGVDYEETGEVTAEPLRKLREFGDVKLMRNEKGDFVTLDANGVKVPDHLADLFADEIWPMIRQEMGQIKSWLSANMNELLVHFPGGRAKLEQILRELQAIPQVLLAARPYEVCDVCGGDRRASEKCQRCKRSGWLPAGKAREIELEDASWNK